jgi:4-oxalomesaconate tautomerase
MDEICGTSVTLIDNGMPCVILRASDMGIEGCEPCAELEANETLKMRLEAIRLKAGPMMNLGDVSAKSVPKMTMVSAPGQGGVISTRSFIPHRCHSTIGVLAAVSVATSCLLPHGPAAELAVMPEGDLFAIEHPGGTAEVVLERDATGNVLRAGTLRTARKLFDGIVFP